MQTRAIAKTRRAALALVVLVLTASETRPGQPTSRPVEASPSTADQGLNGCFGATLGQPVAYDDYEAHAAADPRDRDRLAAAWMTVGPTRRDYVIRTASSFDGGLTWTLPQTLPFVACAGGSEKALRVATDPWVAFGPEGRLYVSAQAYQGEAGGHAGIQHISVITSANNGLSWNQAHSPIVEQGPDVKLDNSSLTPDPSRPGTAYVLTTHFTLPDKDTKPTSPSSEEEERVGRAEISKTTDGGQTWSLPRLITPEHVRAYADLPQMLIEPHSGRLNVFYSNPRSGVGGIFLVTSDDQGSSWSDPILASPYVPLAKRTAHPATGLPLSVAEDVMHPAQDPETGRLFAVFVDGGFTAGAYAQVALVSSSDGGHSWTRARRVNTWEEGPAWLPSIAINARGQLAVTYFDARSESGVQTGQISLWRKTFIASSRGDLVEMQETLLDRFPLGQASTLEPGYFLGDYFSVLALRDAFGALYVKSLSTMGSVRTRVFFSR